MKKTVILLTLALTGCGPSAEELAREKIVARGTDGIYIQDVSRAIEIIKVRRCDYVLWHNGYGSCMQHYEGCQNYEHLNPAKKINQQKP